MARNLSPKFKGVVVQIVCVVEIQFDAARTLTNKNSSITLPCPIGP